MKEIEVIQMAILPINSYQPIVNQINKQAEVNNSLKFKRADVLNDLYDQYCLNGYCYNILAFQKNKQSEINKTQEHKRAYVPSDLYDQFCMNGTCLN